MDLDERADCTNGQQMAQGSSALWVERECFASLPWGPGTLEGELAAVGSRSTLP